MTVTDFTLRATTPTGELYGTLRHGRLRLGS
jgi:hypothetical protein